MADWTPPSSVTMLHTPSAVLAWIGAVRQDLRSMVQSHAGDEGPRISVRVAVSDPLPMFRHGIIASLDDVRVDAEAPDDLRAWAQRPDRRVILLTVGAAADWELLADLCQAQQDAVVIAMLQEPSVASYLRAISAGAAGAMPRTATRSELRAVFQAAVEGSTLLPTEVVQALASRSAANAVGEDSPSRREISWLQDLARGLSVGRLAERAGYSERMMFRLLRDLYTRLGVRNRTEALILARDREWI